MQTTLLLQPYLWSLRNRFRRIEWARTLRLLLYALFGAAVWAGLFLLTRDTLLYFRGIEDVGDLLVLRVHALAWLILLGLLFLSNLVTVVQTLFLSGELPFLLSSPVAPGAIYTAKWLEALFRASWMFVLFTLPIFLNFGFLHDAPAAFYLWFPCVLLASLTIPTGLAVLLAVLLVRILPVRRVRDLVAGSVLIVVVVLFLLMRFAQPERLVQPEAFPSLAVFLAGLQEAEAYWLPGVWASEALRPLMTGTEGQPIFYFLLILFTGLALGVVGYWFAVPLYEKGLHLEDVGGKRRHPLGRASRGENAALASKPGSVLFHKDLLLWVRDPSQWSQLLLLGALILVYLFSLQVLPVRWMTPAWIDLKHTVLFGNIALIGLILAALASRFVFPLPAREGVVFWTIRTAPLTALQFLWNKGKFGALPLVLLGVLLALLSGMLLRVEWWLLGVTVFLAILMAVGLAALALAMGAAYFRSKPETAEQAGTGVWGALFLLAALVWVGGLSFLSGWATFPLALYLVGRGEMGVLEYALLGGAGCAVLVIFLLTVWGSLRWGSGQLEAME
jgi:ABC-2 type transport system permease protein